MEVRTGAVPHHPRGAAEVAVGEMTTITVAAAAALTRRHQAATGEDVGEQTGVSNVGQKLAVADVFPPASVFGGSLRLLLLIAKTRHQHRRFCSAMIGRMDVLASHLVGWWQNLRI